MNLQYHNILDWRMGLDVARLALDPNATVDFSVSYWAGLDAAAAGPYFSAMGWQQIQLGTLQAGRRGNNIEIIVHPLWTQNRNLLPPPLALAVNLASGQASTVTFKSVFEVLRRPY